MNVFRICTTALVATAALFLAGPLRADETRVQALQQQIDDLDGKKAASRSKTGDFPRLAPDTGYLGKKARKGSVMGTFRLGTAVLGWALLVGFGSVACAQFVTRPVEIPRPGLVPSGCPQVFDLNPVGGAIPTLPAATLTVDLSAPALPGPPPPPPAVEVRGFPVVTDDRDRDRGDRPHKTLVQLDAAPAASTSWQGESGNASKPAETQRDSSPESVGQPANAPAAAPWYSVGDWSWGTWVVIVFVGLIVLASGRR